MGKVLLSRHTGLVLLLCREAVRQGVFGVCLVAKNPLEGQGLHD